MTAFLHGVALHDLDGANRFKFGFTRFLGYVWINQLGPGVQARHTWPYRSINRRFLHLSTASLNLIWKLERSAGLYAQASSAYGNTVLEGHASGAERDMQLHLDSIIVYLRILADLVAGAAPFFYSSAEGDIPSRSLRDHLKWFLDREPDFDQAYSDAIRPHIGWFEQLAGKSRQGVRDLLIHRFAYFQTSVTTRPEQLRGRVEPGLITEHGYVHEDVSALIREIVDGLCRFLDAFVMHHATRIETESGWNIVNPNLPHSCEFYRFDATPPSLWLFPIRRDGSDAQPPNTAVP